MLFLAIKHLLSRKRQTLLIVLGIFIGTAGYILISGMILGIQDLMVDLLINNTAHVKITARDQPVTESEIRPLLFDEKEIVRWEVPPSGRRGSTHMEYAQGWFDRLARDPDVVAFTPSLTAQVIFRRGDISSGGSLIGVDAARMVRLTNIRNYMIQGSFEEIGAAGNRIVVGDELMQQLGAPPGGVILLSVGRGSVQPFRIVGFFHYGIPPLDRHTAYGALADVQKINSTPSRIDTISVRIHDVERAGEIAQRWSLYTPDTVTSWDQENAALMANFKVQDAMRYLITFAILIVAAFGIYNVLSITIAQRKREIAILRSVGFDSGDVLRLFLLQGLLLGALGGGLGLVFGYLMSLYLGQLQIYPETMISGGHLPISFDPAIYGSGFFLAFLSSALASVLPARSAGRLTPIDIIRTEEQ